MNQNLKFQKVVEDKVVTEGETKSEEITNELLIDESSLMPTDATEEFIETYEDSDATVEEQEEAVEDVVE